MAGVKKVGKLVICGVGLIGGSFALALRKAGLVADLVAAIDIGNLDRLVAAGDLHQDRRDATDR